jgi:hypothetical protein
VRRFLILVPVMALVGNVVAILVAPKWIRYWFEPPVQAGGSVAFSCTNALDYGIDKMIMMQIMGAVIGAVVGIVLAFLFRSRKPKEPTAPATTPPERLQAKT